jgi:hypothetical protein
MMKTNLGVLAVLAGVSVACASQHYGSKPWFDEGPSARAALEPKAEFDLDCKGSPLAYAQLGKDWSQVIASCGGKKAMYKKGTRSAGGMLLEGDWDRVSDIKG